MVSLHQKLADIRDRAAAKMKARFDQGRVQFVSKRGDLLWIRNHNPENTLAPKRIGPFKVVEMVGPNAVRLEEVPQGPPLGRLHPVVNVSDVEIYEAKFVAAAADNDTPSSILNHQFVFRRKKRHKRKLPRYLVKWSDGSESWEPVRNLVDEDSDGFIFNESLLAYCLKHPSLRSLDGY